MPRAIIIGSSGQDGTILFRKLQLLGFEVLGISKETTQSTLDEYANCKVNICNKEDVFDMVKHFQADHIYHLAAYHHSSGEIIDDEECAILKKSLEVNVLTLHYLLESVTLYSNNSSIFYAASSHVFGNTESEIQTEETPFAPINYYAISKAAGVDLCRYYRKKNSLSIAVGIMYNHESIYRNEEFVSIRIIKGALDILYKKKNELVLGDLEARVDWGSAYDYVDAMYILLKHKVSDDFIIATGVQHSVKDFVEIVFDYLGLDYRDHVIETKNLVTKRRDNLSGNIAKIQDRVDWKPKTTFKKMIIDIVDYYEKNEYVTKHNT